jgi:hypothetical protein
MNVFLPSNISTIRETIIPKELYGYSSTSRFRDVLVNKELAFVNPSLWNDSFEKRYLDTDYTDLGFKQPKIYCMCFATKIENEEAEWRFYSFKKMMTIRYRLNIETLLEVLSEFAKINDFEVFIGNVNYELSKKELQSLHLPKSKHFDSYFKEFSFEKYLGIMTLKPKERKNENELRIFMVSKNENHYSEDILKIPIPEDKYQLLYSNFMVQPYENAHSDNPKDLKYMEGTFEGMRKMYADNFKSLYPNATVVSYKFLKRYSPVKKISLKSSGR